ncbi:MAG: LptF/LptG family permease [Hyphomicrobiales bacterium]
MTLTLSIMLSKMFLSRFVLILFGISAFVLTLDVVTYAADVLELHNDDMRAVLHYAWLRLPGIASAFVGIASLLAALLMLTEVSHNSELVAIWASGISQFRLILILTPAALLIGAFHFMLNDRAVPGAAPILHEWGIGDYSEKKLSVSPDDPLWMRSGDDILRAEKANSDASLLDNLTIFKRDKRGLLVEQISASKAELTEGRWELTDVVIYYRENLPPHRLDRMIYSGLLRPAAAGTRSGDPEEMTVEDLQYFITHAGFGIRPIYVYETWLNKRFSLLFVGLLMVLIAVPLSVRFQRGGGLGLLFAVGVGMGFAFFIFEGISQTMGELGLVPPWMAAWLPLAIFFSAGTAIAFRYETL